MKRLVYTIFVVMLAFTPFLKIIYAAQTPLSITLPDDEAQKKIVGAWQCKRFALTSPDPADAEQVKSVERMLRESMEKDVYFTFKANNTYEYKGPGRNQKAEEAKGKWRLDPENQIIETIDDKNGDKSKWRFEFVKGDLILYHSIAVAQGKARTMTFTMKRAE